MSQLTFPTVAPATAHRPTDGLPLQAISLLQPWASLVILPNPNKPHTAEKEYETRSWQTKVRGPIAIHASKGFPKECQALMDREPFRSVFARHGITKPSDLPTGAIIGVVNWADCITTETADFIIDDQERAFGDYGPKRYAHLLTNPRRLARPRECKGALGFWTIPVTILRALQELDA
jgi:hypothetical protein